MAFWSLQMLSWIWLPKLLLSISSFKLIKLSTNCVRLFCRWYTALLAASSLSSGVSKESKLPSEDFSLASSPPQPRSKTLSASKSFSILSRGANHSQSHSVEDDRGRDHSSKDRTHMSRRDLLLAEAMSSPLKGWSFKSPFVFIIYNCCIILFINIIVHNYIINVKLFTLLRFIYVRRLHLYSVWDCLLYSFWGSDSLCGHSF